MVLSLQNTPVCVKIRTFMIGDDKFKIRYQFEKYSSILQNERKTIKLKKKVEMVRRQHSMSKYVCTKTP